jgi:hypothetical protein
MHFFLTKEFVALDMAIQLRRRSLGYAASDEFDEWEGICKDITVALCRYYVPGHLPEQIQ